MPPKKKKSGKKSGKKSAKKEPEAPPKIEELNEASKEFYLVQLRDMEKRLERYQKRCDELEVVGGNIKSTFDQMTAEKKDIVSYLKKTLDDKCNELADLNDRVIGLQQARDQEKDQFDQQLQTLKTEHQEMKDKLTSENMLLAGKLASLEEFRVQKEKLMAERENLEQTIVNLKEDHKEVIYQLERKQVVDKDRLKKEMVMRVNQVAAEFRKVSNKQMAETTKRTIRENVAINAQLSKMSDKTVELIQENDEIKAKERKQKLQIDLFEGTEKELARKNRNQLKVIQMLTAKCEQLEAELDKLEAEKEAYEEKENNPDTIEQLQALRDENDMLVKTNNQLDAEVAELKIKLAEAQRARDRMGQVIADAADAIKELVRGPEKDDDVPETPIEPAQAQAIAFENLLALLNSASSLGIGPTMEEFSNKAHRRQNIPASARAIQRGELPPMKPPIDSLMFYHPGDLGMVPRSSQHIPTKLDRMKKPPLQSDAEQTTTSWPAMVSVAVQTTSTPKAIFFADKLLDHMSAKDKLLEAMHNDGQGQVTLPTIGKRHFQTTVSAKVF